MNAKEMKKFRKEHHDFCIRAGHKLPAPQLEQMAQVLFPPGSLPDDSNPPFSARELAIIRELLWKTDDMENREANPFLLMSWTKQGATFSV
jgi:hypothetical protein